jgi:hypothetical protein
MPLPDYFWFCITWRHWERKVRGSKSDEYTVRYGILPFDQEYGFSCTCPRYMFDREHNECKHIAEVKHEHCGWNQHNYDGDPITYNDRAHCPKCGEAVISTKV